MASIDVFSRRHEAIFLAKFLAAASLNRRSRRGGIVANNSTGLRHLAHREARFNLVVTSTCFCQPVSFCALKARMSASRLKRSSGKHLRCI
jgi:hypothetical protein